MAYHAVYIPPDNDKNSVDSEESCIYEDLSKALTVIKEYKKARMKTFKNLSDAEIYIKTGQSQASSNHSTAIPTILKQETSNFKTLKVQELASFKKLIENGDVKNVNKMILTNPGYLISSGDTPAIIQNGNRHNALHVAVKANNLKICKLILDVIKDPAYLQLLRGDDRGCETYLDLTHIMLDLYLNTPDKGLNETPLHFAVKFGYEDIVRLLVSYPECIKTLPNKYKQQPIDIICSRRCQEDENLKQEIRMLLEEQFYVPVLRAEDNVCQPVIGEPFSPASPDLNTFNRDLISPRLEIRAFAGPMTKSKAVEFRKKWKTPPRVIPMSVRRGQNDASPSIMYSPNIAMRLQDTEKGLERVGRDLAEECQVPWKEYWPFLRDFVNFRSDEGLRMLEKYLKQRFDDYTMKFTNIKLKKMIEKRAKAIVSANCQQTNASARQMRCQKMPKKTDAMNVDEIQDLCDRLRSLNNTNNEEDTDDLKFFTPPTSPKLVCNDSDDDMQDAKEEGFEIFIEGSSPTKLDHAVYNALSSAISPHMYPCVYCWRHNIQLVMQRDPNRFNNHRSLKRKLFNNT